MNSKGIVTGEDMFGTPIRIHDQVVFYVQQSKGRCSAIEFNIGWIEEIKEHYIFIRFQGRTIRRSRNNIIKYKKVSNKEEF